MLSFENNSLPQLRRGKSRPRSASPIGRSINKGLDWGGAGQENQSVDQGCLLVFAILVVLIFGTIPLGAQTQPPRGFAVERFYPSAPGAGWFVMDDLNISGGLGGAAAVTTGYSRKPLNTVPDELFVDVAAAGTYNRYRVYLNFPIPVLVNGVAGLNVGRNPDTISDPRVGFDTRLWGSPGNSLRLGAGAQLIMPSGERENYVSDGTYRGMFRFLAAGDKGRFSYAGHVGMHIRPLLENEFLFGGAVGRKIAGHDGWTATVGPEIFGETASQTGVEGLLTGRLERNGPGPRLRIKLGVGHGIVQHFAAPQWRVLAGVELFGSR
jgi:hypothetical protein